MARINNYPDLRPAGIHPCVGRFPFGRSFCKPGASTSPARPITCRERRHASDRPKRLYSNREGSITNGSPSLNCSFCSRSAGSVSLMGDLICGIDFRNKKRCDAVKTPLQEGLETIKGGLSLDCPPEVLATIYESSL